MIGCNCFVCKYFQDFAMGRHDFTIPFKRIWFLIPMKILKYNSSDCEQDYPDWQNGKGTKVKPLFGYVFIKTEGGKIPYKWWTELRKNKDIKIK